MYRVCLLTIFWAVSAGVVACATPSATTKTPNSEASKPAGDVEFQLHAFRSYPTEGNQWVAYTKRGFEADGRLIAAAGDGCLKKGTSPQVILPISGTPPGYWLYGTEPSLSGEDIVSIDCLVRLDGAMESGTNVAARLDERPRPDDNFGTLPMPWRQRNQAPVVSTVTPLGVVDWVLSVDRRICWLAGSEGGGWSACLPTGETSGFELKKWLITPEGLRNSTVRTLPLSAAPAGDSKVWLSSAGRAAVATEQEARSSLWVYASPDESPEAWTAGPLQIPGTITSAVFDGAKLHVLSVDFDKSVHRLHVVDGKTIETKQLPENKRPTRLYLSPDGTLWGAELGAAWRLLEGR